MLITQIVQYAPDKEDTVLLIDGFASYLKNGDVSKRMTNLILKQKYLSLSVILFVQKYKPIP